MINQSYMVAIFVTVHSLAEAARRRFVAIINPSRQCEDSCLIFPNTVLSPHADNRTKSN